MSRPTPSTPARGSEERARIVEYLKAGASYRDIVKKLHLPSTWPLRVIAKEERIFRGAQGRLVTEEELKSQVAKRARTKGRTPLPPVVVSTSTSVMSTAELPLRERVIDALHDHGPFVDGRALLDAVRSLGDSSISMERLGTLLYKMRKENIIRADERKSGGSGEHGSIRLTNVRLADRMEKADPKLGEAILDALQTSNGHDRTVDYLLNHVRESQSTATRGGVLRALRDLKAGGRVDYVVRRVGVVDEISFIRLIGPLPGTSPVTREARPAPPAPVAAPVPTQVILRPDSTLIRWPRLTELREREADARQKAKAASKLIDAAAILEQVDPEAFELLMARAESATKAALTPTEEEYLQFAQEGAGTRCMGITLANDPCGGFRGHDGRHYPKPS